MVALLNSITERPPSQTLIVFDKDGVLLDLNATWLPVAVAMGDYLERRCGGATSAVEFLAAVGVGAAIHPNGLFAAGTFAEMTDKWSLIEPKLAAVFADSEAYRGDMRAIIASASKGKTAAKGNVLDTLNALKSMGYALAVVTNDNSESALVNCRDLGIDGFLDALIGADSGFGRKPEATGLLECCRRTEIRPEAAIMVGDTATDYGAFVAAGFKGFIAIAETAPHLPDFIPAADFTFDVIDHIPSALSR